MPRTRIAHTRLIRQTIPTSCCIAMGSQHCKPVCFRRLQKSTHRAYTLPYTQIPSEHPNFTSERKPSFVR
jgi:hypothetical protein